MRGAERVVDVDVAIGREGRRERRVVRLLLRVEAKVLEQDDLAWLEPGERVLRPDAQGIAGAGDRTLEQAREALGDRPETSRLDDLAVGPPEVAHEDDDRTVLERGTRWWGGRPGCGCRP